MADDKTGNEEEGPAVLSESPGRTAARTFERILAVAAAAVSTFLTIVVWGSVSGQQSLWPLPGLYFVELPAAAIVVAVAYLREHPARALLAWVSAGIYLTFSVLGAFTVGLFYVPIAIMLIMLAVLGTSQPQPGFLQGVLALVIAAVAQAALMFLFIDLLYAA